MSEPSGMESLLTATTTSDAAPESAVEEAVEETNLEGNASEAADNEMAVESSAPENEVQEPDPEDVTPDEEVEAASDEESEEVEATAQDAQPKKVEGRAEKRIRESVARAKAAEAKLAETQAQYQQQYQAMHQQMQAQVAAQTQALQEQLNLQRYQLQQAEYKRQQEELAQLSPGQKLEREWLEKARGLVAPEVQAIRQELEQERAQRQEVFRRAKANNDLQQWKSQAGEAAKKVVFDGFDDAAFSKLGPKAQEVLLTWHAASGEDISKSAQSLKAFLEDYHRARLASVSRTSGVKIKQSQATPKVAQGGKVSAGGSAKPSPSQLRAMGFSDAFEWRKAGAPSYKGAVA